MYNLLNHYPIFFPKRNVESYTLKEFLDNSLNTKYSLPIIVNITSLNSYGQSIKNLLTKNTQLLLLSTYQFESVLAEYYRSNDGRHHSHRHRLTVTQGKMASRASSKFRTMKKLSKSFASLTTLNQLNPSTNDDDDNDRVDNDNDNDDIGTSHQRNIVKNLYDKRSSSSGPLCRIPIHYKKFFELLNESGQAAEPCHKLTDLIPPGNNIENFEDRIDKWPHGFYLRSSCQSFKQKTLSETTNDQQSNSTISNDSSYGSSSSDLDLQKNLIILNDEVYSLQAGQILIILGECVAQRIRITDKEIKEPTTPTSPARSSSSNWFLDKSKGLFSRKHRPSSITEILSNEIIRNKPIPKKCEPYLKCQTEQGDIVYISISESGLFSPINFQISRSKSNLELNRFDHAELFQLQNLITNFRFPIYVNHLDGTIFFDNPYSIASINRYETPTKLRLLMQYNEEVIFACPINLPSSKSNKSSSYFILPLSINADIEIQPCLNMKDISKTEDFHKLIDLCYHLIEQYQNEITLIHFPIQFTNRQKEPLYKKRSQSESHVDYTEIDIKSRFKYSNDQLNFTDDYHTENSLSSAPSPLRYRDSIETIKQKLSIDPEQSSIRRSNYYSKIKNDKQKRYSCDEYTFEDEIYEDVDKIYDYIRSGDITDDVEKIQAKEQNYHSSHPINGPISTTRGSSPLIFTTCPSPGKMVTHRFAMKLENIKSNTQDNDFHSCKNDKNVDDDQAHALYLASKQRIKSNSQDLSNPKPVTKMKRIN